ncbi:hypothetical protein [Encephalitozoon cuniculi GB-M1]|uniref:Uncharacterized protein n=1 Tax=Encephalitozoon cuniculi (strain GB-M1) TaxID=284813 RepID=Q8SUL5_ENCCU|nr:uncharacterized protein ECU08_1540 [Encephalitozoon cuniculi GB-M1]CAD26458.1 hypothetical protein [Encephalitozoon cuniculi GB-M1]
MSRADDLEERGPRSFEEKAADECNLQPPKPSRSVKKRVLSMRGENEHNSKHIRMNPHYKKTTAISAIQEADGKEKGGSVLRQAIRRRDLSYISEFLARKDRGLMVRMLSCDDKEVLGELLLEFIDQPLRSEALEMMREIVSSIKDVGVFVERLKERAIDFSKLIYLKGRIDYLRFTIGTEEEKKPEVVVRDDLVERSG